MSSEFDFFRQWYPVSPVEDLDPKRPTPIKLLGLDFVLWQSAAVSEKASETYIALKDECPHRLAPLSEGRIDEKTGQLMCSYHGWRFDEAGVCQHIPQMENPEMLEEQRDRLCATAFPCQVANGLVWIWPDAESAELAAQKALPLSPKVEAKEEFEWSAMVRDLAYNWQTLVENLADPSHAPFAHHGVQGNRDRARPISFKIVASTADLIDTQTEGGFSSQITFEPPCRLEYALDFGGGRKVGLVTYCVPTAPGRSRIVAQFPRNFSTRSHRLTPRWLDHIQNRNEVLDGDMVLLYKQERALQALQNQARQKFDSQTREPQTREPQTREPQTREPQTKTWKTAYTMPTSADRFVIEFRNWFDRYGKATYPWADAGADSEAHRETYSETSFNHEFALDRYHQHTQICSSCRQALKQIKQVQLGLIGLFAVAIATTSVLPDAVRLPWGLPLLLLGLTGLSGAAWLKFRLEPQFYFVDYIHAER